MKKTQILFLFWFLVKIQTAFASSCLEVIKGFGQARWAGYIEATPGPLPIHLKNEDTQRLRGLTRGQIENAVLLEFGCRDSCFVEQAKRDMGAKAVLSVAYRKKPRAVSPEHYLEGNIETVSVQKIKAKLGELADITLIFGDLDERHIRIWLAQAVQFTKPGGVIIFDLKTKGGPGFKTFQKLSVTQKDFEDILREFIQAGLFSRFKIQRINKGFLRGIWPYRKYPSVTYKITKSLEK